MQPAIDSYSFGRMTVGGKLFTSDLIIFPDGKIEASWWRLEGHRLQSEDIRKLIEVRPEIIIAGTGSSGLMRPSPELEHFLSDKKIRLIALPSREAAEVYNSLLETRAIGACFHLTC